MVSEDLYLGTRGLIFGISFPFLATEIEGTFRVNGSNKRMRDLQAVFETPPRVGVPVPQFPAVPTAYCASSSPPFVRRR